MKNAILLLLLLGSFLSAKSYSTDTTQLTADSAEHITTRNKKVRTYVLLVEASMKYLNTRYALGGTTPSGFDCSGFTTYIFKKYDIELPRTSKEQSKTGKRVCKRRARQGDLIFFRGSNARKRRIGHVGIVVSKKGEPISFIHASSRGVVVSTLSESYYKKRFRKVKRHKSLRKKVRI